jgi:hypothetical protein
MKKYDNVDKVKMKSKCAVDKFENESLDLVYIDGDHRFECVMIDILLWLPKIKIGGYICGHDYTDQYVGMAVRKLLGMPHEIFDDSSWLKKIDRQPIWRYYEQ